MPNPPSRETPATDLADLSPAGLDAPVWFRRLVMYSVAAGAAAIVPVPLLDRHLITRIKRRVTQTWANDAGITLEDGEVALLSGTVPADAKGCFLGLLLAVTVRLVVWTIRRFFRTVLFWLLIKDAADAASEVFHEGFLQRLAMQRASADPTEFSNRDNLVILRGALERVCREVDPRPTQKLIRASFRGSRGVLRQLAKTLRLSRRPRSTAGEVELELSRDVDSELDTEAVIAETLVTRLARTLGAQSEYLDELTRRFEAAVENPPANSGRRPNSQQPA